MVTIIFSNSAYGNVLRDQKLVYEGRTIGSELVNPDFVKMAESYGATAYRASTPAELKTTLTRAFADDAPVVIEVPVEKGSEVSPWQFLHPPPPF